MEGQSLDNPRTIGVTPVHRDTLTEELWGYMDTDNPGIVSSNYSSIRGYSDRGVVGYAWKDSPWTIISWDTDSVTQMYGDNLTESIYRRVLLGQSQDY